MTVRRNLIRVSIALVFGLLSAVGVNMFLVHANSYSSGLTGLSQLVQALLKLAGINVSLSLLVAIFNIPLLTRNCESALEEVPADHRAGGLALGLSRWKTVTKIMLPEAIPGVLTGIILSAGRIFGEAAALIYTSGQSVPAVSYANWNPLSADSFLNPMRPAETLAVHIWKLNTEGLVTNAHQISSGASAVLVIVVLLFNVGARLTGRALKKRLGQ